MTQSTITNIGNSRWQWHHTNGK